MGFDSHWDTLKQIVCNGKSHLEMDDDWGYAYFRKLPYVTNMKWDLDNGEIEYIDRIIRVPVFVNHNEPCEHI